MAAGGGGEAEGVCFVPAGGAGGGVGAGAAAGGVGEVGNSLAPGRGSRGGVLFCSGCGAGAALGGAGAFGGAGAGAAAGGGGVGCGGGAGGAACGGAAAGGGVGRGGGAAAGGGAAGGAGRAGGAAGGAAFGASFGGAAFGASFGGALGLPSGPSSSLACATTSGAVCACDSVLANCIAVSAVVASSTRRSLVMMVWVPGKILGEVWRSNE